MLKKTDLKGSIEIRKYEINSYLKFVFTTILIMCVSLLDLYLLTNKFSGLLLAMFFLLSILFVCQFVHFFTFVVPVIKAISGSSAVPADDNKIFNYIEQLIGQRQKEYAQEQTRELSLKQAEFNELQSQINPHFLYNTLESIRAEALSENSVQVANMVRSLSSFYRYCIGRYRTLVTFREELENIENYFSIQRYRFGNRFYLNVNISPENQCCMDLKIIKMSLQPLVENAIYHGLETKFDKGHVTISTELTQSRFIIVVSDDGVGIAPDTLNKINMLLNMNPRDFSSEDTEIGKTIGVGLMNINQRIKMYFGEDYGLIVRSIKDIGTDIEITLPLVTDMEI